MSHHGPDPLALGARLDLGRLRADRVSAETTDPPTGGVGKPEGMPDVWLGVHDFVPFNIGWRLGARRTRSTAAAAARPVRTRAAANVMGSSPFGLTVGTIGLPRLELRWKSFAKGSTTVCPWLPTAYFEPHGY